MRLGYDKRLHGWRFVLFNLSLGVGHALVLFNAGAYIAMLPRVSGGLGIPLSYATWTQTDYMVGLALAFPVGGWLSRRLGEYRPFVAAFMVYALASLICAVSTSHYGFLAGRILLGFSGGLTLPLGQSLIMKEYSDKRKSFGIGVWSLFTLTPFTLGPPLGGWIADNLGWRWLFWLNIPTALAVGGFVGALLCHRGYRPIYRRFDTIGFLLMAMVAGGVQTLLNQGNDLDWFNSGYLSGLALMIVIVSVYFVIWELSLRHPFVDLRLFAHRNFAICTVIIFLGFFCFQGLLSLLIVQLQLSLGYSSLLAGLVFLPLAVFSKPMSSVFHEVVKRVDARLLASICLLGFALTYFWLSRFDEQSAYDQLVWPKLLEGVCLGCFFAPLTALLTHGLTPVRQWRAVELAGLLRIAAGGLGITFQGVVLYRRIPLHQTRIAESMTPLDPGLDQALNTLTGSGFSESAALVKLARLAFSESVIMSMNDAFLISGYIFVGLAILVWFAKPAKQPAVITQDRDLHSKELEELAEQL